MNSRRGYLLVLMLLLCGCAATTPAVTGVTAGQQAYIERELGALAQEITAAPPATATAVYARLRAFVAERPAVFGSALAYAPGMAPDPATMAAYVWRDGATIREKNLAHSGDYTKPEVEWYFRPAHSGRPGWCAPYFDTLGAGANVKMVTYSIPLHTPGATPQLLGVLTADVLLERN